MHVRFICLDSGWNHVLAAIKVDLECEKTVSLRPSMNVLTCTTQKRKHIMLWFKQCKCCTCNGPPNGFSKNNHRVSQTPFAKKKTPLNNSADESFYKFLKKYSQISKEIQFPEWLLCMFSKFPRKVCFFSFPPCSQGAFLILLATLIARMSRRTQAFLTLPLLRAILPHSSKAVLPVSDCSNSCTFCTKHPPYCYQQQQKKPTHKHNSILQHTKYA